MTKKHPFAQLMTVIATAADQINNLSDKTVDGGTPEFRKLWPGEMIAGRLGDACHYFLEYAEKGTTDALNRLNQSMARDTMLNDPETGEITSDASSTRTQQLEIEYIAWLDIIDATREILGEVKAAFHDSTQTNWAPYPERIAAQGKRKAHIDPDEVRKRIAARRS